MHRGQRAQVVHVAREVRHRARRARLSAARPGTAPCAATRRARGTGSRRSCSPAARRRRRRRRGPARPRRRPARRPRVRSRAPSRAAAAAELVVHAVHDHALQRHAQLAPSCCARYSASPSTCSSGLVTSTNAVSAPRSTSYARSTRLVEVLEEAAHAGEEVGDLGERRDAGRLLDAAEEEARGAVHGAQRRPAGASSTGGRTSARRCGRGSRRCAAAPRGSRARGASAACRRRSGRSGRSRRARRAARSPCTRASRRRSARGAGRTDWRGCARAPRPARGARRARPRRPSGRASSRRACRAPCASPCVANSAARDLPRLAAERREAERAGEPARRVDREDDRRAGPASAPQSAIDAATVVLPTPPLPAEMTMRWRSTSFAQRHAAPRASAAPTVAPTSPLDRRARARPAPNSSAKRNGSSTIGVVAERRRAGARGAALLMLRPAALLGRASATPARSARSGGRRGRGRRCAAPRATSASKRRRWTRFTTTSPAAVPSAPVSCALRLERLRRPASPRRASPGARAVVRGVAQQVDDLRRLALHEPGAERLARRLRHAQILQAVAGRRRVDDDDVPGRRPPSSRVASYQILPTVMSSFSPGAAATKYW